MVEELIRALLVGAQELDKKRKFGNAIALFEEVLFLNPVSRRARDGVANVLVEFGEQLRKEGRFNDAG